MSQIKQSVRSAIAAAIAFSVAAHGGVAAADSTVDQPPSDAEPAEATPMPMEPEVAPAPAPARRSRARFSGKRLAAEIVSGAVVGSLVSYGTYKALGGDSMGAAFGAIGANFAVTPLVEYGVGRAMGGKGSLGWTYMGGLLGFSASGAPPDVTLAVAIIALPITSGLMYEVSSNRWAMTHDLNLSVTPVGDNNQTTGARADLSFTF